MLTRYNISVEITITGDNRENIVSLNFNVSPLNDIDIKLYQRLKIFRELNLLIE